jgi:hypothetical protein
VDDLAPLLDREVAVFVQRLRAFTPSRWRAAAPPYENRAQAVFQLAQRLAELAAAPSPVPWVGEHALADQVSVLGRDLVGMGPLDDVRMQALDEIRRTRDLLGI